MLAVKRHDELKVDMSSYESEYEKDVFLERIREINKDVWRMINDEEKEVFIEYMGDDELGENDIRNVLKGICNWLIMMLKEDCSLDEDFKMREAKRIAGVLYDDDNN